MTHASEIPSAPRRRRVAVIAVHGVADQKPDESNEAVAGLLAKETIDGQPSPYSAFTRRRLELPLAPVRAGANANNAATPKSDARLKAIDTKTGRRGYLDRATQARTDRSGDSDPDWELGYQFMTMQLEDYVPKLNERTHETSVLEGTHGTAGSVTPADDRGPDLPAARRSQHLVEVRRA